MNQITTSDIEKFLEYVGSYDRTVNYENKKITVEAENTDCGKARKLSAIRALFKYLFKEEIIKSNVAALVDSPKIHDKAIIRLEADEIANLLDEVENGERLTDGQKRFHEATYKRDLALITLMLGTGIRISECVGLNINDIDFETNSFKVTRKGGNEVVLFINDEIARTLEAYLEQRLELQPEEGDEDALFLSLQKKRITPRSVQNLVKKYSRIIAPLKKISPHKLRSTYGTALYHETSDIYLVADVLGHRDVNTTKKHYAAMSEDEGKLPARLSCAGMNNKIICLGAFFSLNIYKIHMQTEQMFAFYLFLCYIISRQKGEFNCQKHPNASSRKSMNLLRAKSCIKVMPLP